MRALRRREIVIDAPPDRVWARLTSFESYPEGDPFVAPAAGAAVEGGRLRVTSPPGGRKFSFDPHVNEVVPGRVFEWWGHVGVPGVFDARRRFGLYPFRDGTRLVHAEAFTGVLVPLLWRGLRTRIGTGLSARNQAVKARVEGVAAETA